MRDVHTQPAHPRRYTYPALAFKSVNFRRPSAEICGLPQVRYLNQNITVELISTNISIRYQTILWYPLTLHMIPKNCSLTDYIAFGISSMPETILLELGL